MAQHVSVRMVRNYIAGRYFYRPAPIWIDFRLTNRCNQHCQYCDIPSDGAAEMTTAQVRMVIDKTKHVSNWILLTGGECLLRPDVGAIIDYVKATTDMQVVLNTNMSLLCKAAASIGQTDVIFFSIDGRPETHDTYRHPGSYARVVEALERLAHAPGRRPALLSLTVLHKGTEIEDLDHVLELSERYGFGPNFQLIRHYGLSRGSRPLDAHDDHGLLLLDHLVRAKRAGRFMTNTTRNLRVLADVARGVDDTPCYSGRLFCFVNTAGEVGLCFSRPHDPRYLSLIDPEVSFETALARLAEIRPGKERCRGCTCTTPIEFATFSWHDPQMIGELLSTFRTRRPAGQAPGQPRYEG